MLSLQASHAWGSPSIQEEPSQIYYLPEEASSTTYLPTLFTSARSLLCRNNFYFWIENISK